MCIRDRPPKIRELAKTILRNPAEVNIAISKPNEAIDQSAYVLSLIHI